VGSSRTDSGVHAKGQVAHFDTTFCKIPPAGMQRAINNRLPDDIDVRSVEAVPDSFDAISSTVSKRYQYYLWNTRRKLVHCPDLAWNWWRPLDIDRMREAAKRLVGTHDFASFAKAGHFRETTVRTVLGIDISCRSPGVVIGVEGTGFLWNMVRIIVGTLVQVGMKTYDADDVTRMLEARDRRASGHTAPPQGLYLHWIKFADPGEQPASGPADTLALSEE
jgi:tRNA pseudouridine38-40 synthase